MLTNIDLDETLVAEAMKVSGARTKREVVDRALREMVARSKRARFRDIWAIAKPGDLWDDYDPKAAPGEPPGRYRVEEGTPTYKRPPPAKKMPGGKSPAGKSRAVKSPAVKSPTSKSPANAAVKLRKR
ncbi:MAG TPA: type II toxin-antitoxin system VapB family antitoxin [Ramlibacter sp.]|uniref:type II toxin-antitoxin system VapB family antitoxin n=1 Tax=Ramlibacter sp. TaxID=1917967 RepID=UPI002BF8069D|nr:type II toxin-antitoxin system VapB family antitoxin [Ramlibacter sp.]HVZ43976.1 type II toxin-antitoxin system VapB family antitoxin [Ramlibacter sp.]